MLTASFQVGSYTISTFGVFLFLGILLAAYGVWSEGRKDGFEETKMFDLFFLSVGTAILFSRSFFYLGIYGALFGAGAMILGLCKIWKWSVYRVLDIFSLAAALGASIISLAFVALQRRFEFLFLFALWLFVYAIFTRLRNSKIKSGVIFSLFLALCIFVGVIFFRNAVNLLFYFLLVTLSLINLYFRGKREAMSQKISPKFLDFLKEKLTSKEKDLSEAEDLLIEEDPYMASGRTSDNADLEDDTHEDIEKTNVDTRRNLVSQMKIQVKKALGKMKRGTYGTCEICGKEIDQARLKAYPEATTCLECSKDQSE